MVEMVPVVCLLWVVKGAQCVMAPTVATLGQAGVVLTGPAEPNTGSTLEGGL